MRLGLLLLACLCLSSAGDPRRDSFDFRYDVLPLLYRQGCGSAYCHGAATGMGGFKLSLFASDPAADHAAITRDLGGRRLDLRHPTHSLLIRKPSMQTRHKGGRRLREGRYAYTTLTRWIAEGAPYRSGSRRELISLELAKVAGRLRAEARFRDDQGEFTRDVTELCTFRSSDDRIVKVDKTGRLAAGLPGEAWLFARYVTRTARISVVQPYGAVKKPDAASNELDRLWLARLHDLGLEPATPAPTSVLARRLYLDLAGRLPTPAELAAFEALDAEERVAKIAAALVDSADFAVKFGRHLAQWMEIPLEPPARPNPRTAVYAQQHQRLVAAVQRGERLDTIARRLIVGDRTLLDRSADPRDRAELAGRAFLGIRIGCARCHNSPIDKWERKDHLAFSALFASPRPDPHGGMLPGKLFDPKTGMAVPPRTLPVEASLHSDPVRGDLAESVARFVLQGSHGMFERNIANRTFAALMGRGLVEPLDDNRLGNPAVHESLLRHLAQRAKSGNLRELVLHIVTSRLYQTSSEPTHAKTDDAAVHFFARRVARTMPPAMFANAVARAVGGDPRTRLTPSPLARQLALLNSAFLHDAVRDSAAIANIGLFAPDTITRLGDLYLLLLTRRPRSDEIAAFLPGLEKDDIEGVHDLAFALLASREFGSIR